MQQKRNSIEQNNEVREAYLDELLDNRNLGTFEFTPKEAHPVEWLSLIVAVITIAVAVTRVYFLTPVISFRISLTLFTILISVILNVMYTFGLYVNLEFKTYLKMLYAPLGVVALEMILLILATFQTPVKINIISYLLVLISYGIFSAVQIAVYKTIECVNADLAKEDALNILRRQGKIKE